MPPPEFHHGAPLALRTAYRDRKGEGLRRRAKRVFLAVLFTGAAALAFWLGLVPQRYSPFAPLDLKQKDAWFLDFRMAALKADPQLCEAVLKEPLITASAVGDRPLSKGCGWRNAVRISAAGGAQLAVGTISCPMAGALAMWLEHEVQPAAQDLLSSKVVSIRHLGGYACRNIVGARGLRPFRSQHATANAIDVSAFVLADGRSITLARHWHQDGPEAHFLKRIHKGACRFFRVAIGPNFNAAHADHFHLDRGAFKSCR